MRTVVAATLVLGLAMSSGCANRRVAVGLGAAAAASLVYAAATMATASDYCSNAFGGEWGAKHECGPEVIVGFAGGIGFGLASAVSWGRVEQEESPAALEEQGRAQRTHFLEGQAHDAATRGDCTETRDRANRIASIDPKAVRSLVLSDPLVRACLAPATNRAP